MNKTPAPKQPAAENAVPGAARPVDVQAAVPPGSAVVLLPTYNEADNLEAMLAAIWDAVPTLDIMVLDDNSPDGTGQLAEAMTADEPRLRVVHRHKKAGLGAAYIDGFHRALQGKWRYVIQMDADFSHPPTALPTMLTLAQTHDLVLGSRWVPGGGTRNWPRRRRFISRGGSLYARWILGVQVADLTGGFKCFRRKVLEALPLYDMRAAGYAFQIEMTYRAIRAGFDVCEMPITFVERLHGSSKMSGSIFWEAVVTVPGLRLGGR